MTDLYEPILANLERRLRAHSCVLFLGAGFSLEALDAKGNAIPSGRQLAEELFKLLWPRDSYDGSALRALFRAAARQQAARLTEHLRARLTVRPDSLPDFYELYFRLPWRRIYTTNIDTLAQAVMSRWSLPISLEICGREAQPRFEMAASPDGRPVVQYVHLNGQLKDLPDGVVFSTEQYGRELATGDRWTSTLGADMVGSTVVYVGTQLDEPHLARAIALRGLRQPKAEEELRPASYLVSPVEPLRATKQELKDSYIEWLPQSAKEFSGAVLARLPAAAPQARGGNPMAALHVARLRAESTADTRGVDYLLGAEPTWHDLRAGLVAPREAAKHLVAEVVSALDKRAPSLIALVGTRGCGKTTVAMSAAAQVSDLGRECFYVSEGAGIARREIEEFFESREADLLVIDGPQVGGEAGAAMLRRLFAGGRVRTIVALVPSQRFEQWFAPEIVRDLALKEVSVPNLTDSDIDGLLLVLEKRRMLGLLASLTPAARVRAFRTQLDRQLLAAMIQVTQGRSLREKVVEEYDDLEPTDRLIYGLLVLPTALGTGLLAEEILLAADGGNNAVLNGVRRMHRRGLLIQRPSGRFALRHSVIALEMEKYLRVTGHLQALVIRLLPMLELRTADRSRPAFDLLKRLVNHNSLRRWFGEDGARSVYSAVEDALGEDHHYWLQRGEAELEWGSPSIALGYLSHAKRLAPGDWFVDVGIANARLRIAREDPDSDDGKKNVDDAFAALEDLIRAFGDRGEHPYHILAREVVRWAQRSAADRMEKRARLARARDLLAEGLKRFPFSDRLQEARPKVERAWLMTTVVDPQE